MQIESAAVTHVGRRSNNEDDHCVDPTLGLYAVADGMGGYEGGEVASHIVVDTLTRFFARNADDADVTWPVGIDPALTFAENLMIAGIDMANRHVRAERRGRLRAMGATLAALCIKDERAVVAHVGDSRVYRLREGELEGLTVDHSLLAELAAAGLSTPADHNVSNVVTRAIGTERCRPDVRSDDARPGDVYLVCSDGLYEPIDDDDIRAALASFAPERAASRLVQAAYDAGGSDNITALVVRVLPR
jgi:serine/threonine protein phosphatase PrpC